MCKIYMCNSSLQMMISNAIDTIITAQRCPEMQRIFCFSTLPIDVLT